jgi:hypothetical protein
MTNVCNCRLCLGHGPCDGMAPFLRISSTRNRGHQSGGGRAWLGHNDCCSNCASMHEYFVRRYASVQPLVGGGRCNELEALREPPLIVLRDWAGALGEHATHEARSRQRSARFGTAQDVPRDAANSLGLVEARIIRGTGNLATRNETPYPSSNVCSTKSGMSCSCCCRQHIIARWLYKPSDSMSMHFATSSWHGLH